MKSKIFLTTIFLVSTMVFTTSAQEEKSAAPIVKKEQRKGQIPNLTEDQQTKIKAIKTSHLKTTTDLKNQLNEKKAHLKTLTTKDNPDQKEIDATIDQITALQNKMMKNSVGMRLEIRALLTDEQKVYFDSHMMKRKKAARMKAMQH